MAKKNLNNNNQNQKQQKDNNKNNTPIKDPNYPNVFNIAKITLPPETMELLNLGLKFCPKPISPNMGDNEIAINNLIRKIKIQIYMDEEENFSPEHPNQIIKHRHKTPSKWQPKITNPKEKLYLDDLQENLFKAKRKITSEDNITPAQRKALRELRNNKKIIIKPADKGSGTVILTPHQYETEVHNQLNNKKHYKKLEKDITGELRLKIGDTLKHFTDSKFIPPDVTKILIPETVRPARFYILPKIHKNLENPPGRPIMSANGHVTERISEYVDLYLQKYISTTKSYIKDTNHLIELLKDLTLPTGSRLITFDVSALYTNIPHDEGIQAVKIYMTKHYTEREATLITTLTKLVLESNNFVFDNQHYIQTSGTAMGTRMAPCYANIFMDSFEERHLPNIPIPIILWKRYIDDILVITNTDDEGITRTEEWLNSLHHTIKFTAEHDPKGIPFLDTFLTVEKEKIRIRPYTKKTDTKQYLLPNSCHPPHIIKSIPFSQALRIKRICTNQDDYQRELTNLKGYFLNRKYEKKLIDEQFKKANTAMRGKKNNRDTAPTVLVIFFHPENPNYQKIINEIWHKHNNLGNTDTKKPIVAYKRPKNLRDLLTKAEYNPKGIKKTLPHKPLIQSTVPKAVMSAENKIITLRCQKEHYHSTEEIINLETAWNHIKEPHTYHFTANHTQCGKITIENIEVDATLITKCTQCDFQYKITINQPLKPIEEEIRHGVETIQRASHRKKFTTIPRCKNLRCITCQNKITSPTININHKEIQLLPPECNQQNLIYIIQCKKCKKIYIGETESKLSTRYIGHRTAIKQKKNTGISTHFNQPNHNPTDMKISLLDTCESTTERKTKEAIWISKFELINNGINVKDERQKSTNLHTLHIVNHFNHNPTCLPYFIKHYNELPLPRTLKNETSHKKFQPLRHQPQRASPLR